MSASRTITHGDALPRRAAVEDHLLGSDLPQVVAAAPTPEAAGVSEESDKDLQAAPLRAMVVAASVTRSMEAMRSRQ